jgi:hypothetical protein
MATSRLRTLSPYLHKGYRENHASPFSHRRKKIALYVSKLNSMIPSAVYQRSL